MHFSFVLILYIYTKRVYIFIYDVVKHNITSCTRVIIIFISVVKKIAEVTTEDIDESLLKISEENKSFTEKNDKEKAEVGDQVTIDFIGKIDGEVFEGGSANDAPLILGSSLGFETGDLITAILMVQFIAFPAALLYNIFAQKIGVKNVFLLPGGGAMHLVDAVGKNSKIEVVACLHEQAAAISAEAYSRINETISRWNPGT